MDDINSDEAIKKAKKVLDDISSDEVERELAFQRLMYKMDQEAIEAAGFDKGMKQGKLQGLKEGKLQGLEEGKLQGLEKGKKEKAIEIAKKLLHQHVPLETIMDCTGLSKEDIESL